MLCGIDQTLGAINFLLKLRITERLFDNEIHPSLQNGFHCFLEGHQLIKGTFETIAVKFYQQIDIALVIRSARGEGAKDMQSLHVVCLTRVLNGYLLQIDHE